VAVGERSGELVGVLGAQARMQVLGGVATVAGAIAGFTLWVRQGRRLSEESVKLPALWGQNFWSSRRDSYGYCG
jgi:hypothetical protein